MEEIYRTSLGILYKGDCLDYLKIQPDKSMDVVVTDPPYGVRNDDWDLEFDKNLKEWLGNCLRISKRCLWFCSGIKLPMILSLYSELQRLLIWVKPKGSQFSGAMNSNLWYSIEPILVYGEMLPNDKNKKYGYSHFVYRTVPERKYGHPTTKPLGLMKDLIYFYSNENEIVLDPFMGSGTTAVACELLRRKWVGIEKEEKYCKIIIERLKTEARPRKTFI